MRITKLCFEINGGGCKNKVSARNGYICAAGHSRDSAARPAVSISKMGKRDKEALAQSTEDEATQWGLFRTEDWRLQRILAMNPSIDEKLQWELFRTGDDWAKPWLARNPSIGRELAIELAKAGKAPSGYLSSKTLTELAQPENLALLGQYPKAFSQAYLERLLYNGQKDKEESKALILHSYFIHEKSGGEYAKSYKDTILLIYKGDQEIELIINTEPSQ